MSRFALKIDRRTTAKKRFGLWSVHSKRSNKGVLDLGVLIVIICFALIAVYALVTRDPFLCVEAIFLVFIPYVLWSAYRRVGVLDFFAPDVGFPILYVLYLFIGSINLPLETQFGLVLPWYIWVYYIIGLAAYLLGVKAFGSPKRPIGAYLKPKLFWRPDRLLTASLVLFAIGWAARAVEIAKWGLAIFHASDENARVIGAGGLLGVLAICMDAAFECMLLYLLIAKPKGFLRLFILACMTLTLLNAIATTNRTALMRIVLAAVVVIHYSRYRFRVFAVALVTVFAIVFISVLGTFRDLSEWGNSRIASLEQQGFTSKTFWLFNGYEAVRLPTETFDMTIEQVPSVTPYSYGATSLASLTEILPGHRPGPSEIVKDKLRLNFIGFGAAATILAPLWFDGGTIGIVIGMFLFGVLSRYLHRRMLLSGSYVWVLVYGWFVQNAFKAIKDDIFPELGVAFVITLFILVGFVLGRPTVELKA